MFMEVGRAHEVVERKTGRTPPGIMTFQPTQRKMNGMIGPYRAPELRMS